MIWLGGKTDRAPLAQVVFLINDVRTTRSFQEWAEYPMSIWKEQFGLMLIV